ncbi:MAG: response regulator, partial [Gammaproteobacteria bacterium]|nr:response regulator [Gammaproteobacteria bacterium]
IMDYQAYSKGLELIGDIEDDLQGRVFADAQRLRQIMVNLVGNAIKFTDQGEIVVHIRVGAEASGQASLRVEISDNGIGMSKATQASMFNAFGRSADPDAAFHKQGSGLGLSISKQLVDLMGGEMSIKSAPGEGTTVRFSVPVEVLPASNADLAQSVHALKGCRMLIVDDNVRVSRVICSNLHSWGMHCKSVRFPNQVFDRIAGAAAAGQPFDGVIINIDLPDADGLSLARAIRAQSDLAHLPIILLTSIAQPLEVGEVSPLGGIRCVNKPILPSELRHNLYRLLEVDDWEGRRNGENEVRTLRILVAEDNPLNRKLLSRMLESLDHRVDCVDDGPAALRAFEEKSYDLILMDCQMPGLDGDEVTRKIRNTTDKNIRQPIIIAVTADISAEHKSKCLQAGMDDFLTKPIRLQVLESGLRRWSAVVGESDAKAGVAEHAPGNACDQETLRHLRDRAGGDGAAFVSDYIDLFLRDTSSRLEVMRAAVEHEDAATLGRECHALKGACLEVGVSQLGACCDALRDASKDGRFNELRGALDRLSEEFERVKPVFEAEKNRSA